MNTVYRKSADVYNKLHLFYDKKTYVENQSRT